MNNLKRNDGFTLIELLAVIVILAIIALIAVPTIMKVVNNAIKESFLNDVNGIIRSADLYYYKQQMLGEELETMVFRFPDDVKELALNGNMYENGMVKISVDGEIEVAISNGKYCAKKTKIDSDIVLNQDIESCVLPYEDIVLNGADPVLKTGMIPVTIENDGTVKKADIALPWYSYGEKKWANAVTVSEANREKYVKMKIGGVISEEDILTYFVWIPRYKYKLWYVEATDGYTNTDANKVHSIDIVFENKETEKSNGTANGEYLTHPAFTLGDDKLNGIWVGKFETGFNGATSAEEAKHQWPTTNNIIIKPNVYSWSYISTERAFVGTKNMNITNNIFGLNTNSDTHMMKNTEWGAVVYLSHSEYGTCFDGECGQVYKNNSSNYMTGCGADTENETTSDTCKNAYGTKGDGIYNQSTTKNITGIFDMSGGRAEYVMGCYEGAASFAESKYVDGYLTETNRDFSKRILGDATGELGPFKYGSSWYKSTDTMPISNRKWFHRGGNKIFDFATYTGNPLSYSFRIVLS